MTQRLNTAAHLTCNYRFVDAWMKDEFERSYSNIIMLEQFLLIKLNFTN